MKLTVYTSTKCMYCRQVKEWLTERGCEYDERVINKDVEALREWRSLTGGVGVPVVAFGKDFVIGYNKNRLQELLQCSRTTTPVDEEMLEGLA